MDTRRDFFKKAVMLAAAGGGSGHFAEAIAQALAIDPAPGSTFLDAEHVVILMQENRSFDHAYGSLPGVRGFNDPRAVSLPNGHPVWLQSNAKGETYPPFRLNIKDTNATWMGCLPHSWRDQLAARHGGKHDRWLDFKASGQDAYADMPLTIGFYAREDIPFYYALADAFTVCDQNFCSSLTGTTPNRLHLWTGTIRAEASPESKACVLNSDCDHGTEVSWTTFPERLEEHGISWAIYQNELYLDTGLSSEAQGWLDNFGDNPIEHFTQYHVRFLRSYRDHLPGRRAELEAQLARLEAAPKPWPPETVRKVERAARALEQVKKEIETYTEEAFAALSARERSIHQKAFVTNIGDPHYRDIEPLSYNDGGTERKMVIPKGDVLHQFREDAKNGKLPAVSWLVAPQYFSDHPDSPWYGAWYLAEALSILTSNPEVWKKTIFILCYDENDGYFDHVPPFVPPQPGKPETGLASAGLKTELEYVGDNPIGLGYRVPLVIASPWSRGGRVCSEVFDHTSILRFLEKWLSHKSGHDVRETNITPWRRAMCGDLTSAFRPWQPDAPATPGPLTRETFLPAIHQAQFRPVPAGPQKLFANDIAVAQGHPKGAPWMPRQEAGLRPSNALPYELAVSGRVSDDRKSFVIEFAAKKELFGERAAGAPFHVYAPGLCRPAGRSSGEWEAGRVWAFAVAAGDRLQAAFPFGDFADGRCHLRVHGPNGFFREFSAAADDPPLEISLAAQVDAQGAAQAAMTLKNLDPARSVSAVLEDVSYGAGSWEITLAPAGSEKSAAAQPVPLAAGQGWHDLAIRLPETPGYLQRFAGRIETGSPGVTDPLLAEG